MAAGASLSVSRPRNPFRLPPPPPPTMPSGAAGELFSIRTCFKFLFAAIFRPRSFLAGFLGRRGPRFSNHHLRLSANSKWRRRQPRRVVTSLRKAPPTIARAAFPATAPARCWARGGVRACAVLRGGGKAVGVDCVPMASCLRPGTVVPFQLRRAGESASNCERSVFVSAETDASQRAALSERIARPEASLLLLASSAPSASDPRVQRAAANATMLD